MSRTKRDSWRTWYARWGRRWFGQGKNKYRSYTDCDGCGKPPGWDRPTKKRIGERRADLDWHEHKGFRKW